MKWKYWAPTLGELKTVFSETKQMWKYTPRDHKQVSILSGKGITCIGKGESRRLPGVGTC